MQEPRESLLRVPPLAPATEPPTDVGRGEAIGFSADGNGYFTAKEGRQTMLYYYPAKTPAPTDVTATVEASSVKLSWQTTTGDITAFQIERRIGAAGGFTRVGETPASVVQFELRATPRAEETWHFRVRAKTSEGYSAFSTTTAVTGVAPKRNP